MMWWIISDQ